MMIQHFGIWSWFVFAVNITTILIQLFYAFLLIMIVLVDFALWGAFGEWYDRIISVLKFLPRWQLVNLPNSVWWDVAVVLKHTLDLLRRPTH